MTLLNEFKRWQEKLIALQQEGEEIYQRIEQMERQNVELRQKLATDDDLGGGYERLSGIYQDGFHICPGSFGQSRDEDCLFCLNFLLKIGKK